MGRIPAIHKRKKVATVRALALVLVSLVTIPVAVSASVFAQNFMSADVTTATEGPSFYDYQAAQQTLWTTAADWGSGTFANTSVSAESVILTPTPAYEICVNSGGPDFTGTDGTFYQADAFATGGGTYTFVAPIANTTDDALFQRIRYAFTTGGIPTYTYAIPVPAAGTYSVEVGIVESFNNPPYQNQTDLTIEGVQVLNDFDPFTTTGGQHNATYHTFTTTTPDATVDLLIGHAGWYGALTFACVRSAASGASTGTWTSPVIDTLATGTNVFGLIGAATTEPAGTDIDFRLSFGATPAAAAAGPFVGPDGTTATSYDPNSPIGYQHDFGDQYVAVQAELSTTTPGTTPSLDRAWFTYDLAEVGNTMTSLSVTSSPVGQTGWVLRVRADDPSLTGTTGTINLLGSSGIGEATVGTDHPSTQIDIIAGTPVQTSGPPFSVGPASPHSVLLEETAMLGGRVRFRWQAMIGGVIVAHDVEIVFA